MIELPAVSMNIVGVIGGIHQFVQVDHALGSQCHQRNGDLRVVYAGAGQHSADRHLSVGHVKVKLVTTPVLLVTLAVLLGSYVTLPGQFAQHPRQLLMTLPLDARTALGGFSSGKTTWGMFVPALLYRLLFLLLLVRLFRKTFAPGWRLNHGLYAR